MDMKKTVTILSVMLVCVAVFFCVPVNAATYTGSPAVHKSASGSSQGVTWEISLDQYYPIQNADGGIAAGETYTMVYYRITNSNDDAAYVRNTGFTIQWVTAPYIVRYETVSDDLLLGYQNTSGSWYIYGDSPYSYSNGIVVGPHSSLYCVAYIVTSDNVNGTAISGQVISSVSLSNHTVTLGDYPYGNGTSELQDIDTLLHDLITQLTFTGTITEYNPLSYSTLTFNYDQPYNNVSISCGITRLSSFALSDTAVILSNTDAYQSGSQVIPFQVSFRINNYNAENVLHPAYFIYAPTCLPATPGISYVMHDFRSNIFESYQMQYTTVNGTRYLQLRFFYKFTDADGSHLPYGIGATSFTLLAIKDDDVADPVISNPPVSIPQYTFQASIRRFVYNPEQSINSTLEDLYNAYSQVNGVGDLSDQSNDLTEGLKDAHQTEQNYFESNSEALSNSGISNPNFEASDRTGINSAISGNKNQFGMLWNAIGAWRNVYIYAALLCLVTYLLRHKPWISGGRRHRLEENG